MTMNDNLEMPKPLSPEARAVLEAARDADDPRESDRLRVGRALLKRAVAAGAVGASAGLLAKSAAAATLAKSILLPALFVVAGGVLGGAVVWSTRPVRLPGATAPTPAASSPTPSATAVASLTPPAALPGEAPPPAPVALPTAPTNHLAGETALLADVTVALRNGDAREGLRLLDVYQHRYPAGVLREEMRGARIIARCQLAEESGNPAARVSAEKVARGFLRSYPASPLAPRIRKACASSVR